MSWLQPSGVAGTRRDELLRAGAEHGKGAVCAVCPGVSRVSRGAGLSEGLSDARLCFGRLEVPRHPSPK